MDELTIHGVKYDPGLKCSFCLEEPKACITNNCHARHYVVTKWHLKQGSQLIDRFVTYPQALEHKRRLIKEMA